MIKLNPDIETRDKIIYPDGYNPNEYFGGIRHFRFLSVQDLTTLIENGFVDILERQNDAPSIRRIYGFMKEYPQYTAHGYTVDISREDYRISIEGVEKGTPGSSHKEIHDFYELFSTADTYLEDTMYCWFD